MADYGERYGEFRQSGIEVVGLTPEGPRQARRLRTGLKLPFPVLCDASRDAARAFGLLSREPGKDDLTPATLVLDAQRRMRLSALNSGEKCVFARDMLEYARAVKSERVPASAPPLQSPKPGRLFLRAIANVVTSIVRPG